MKFCEAIEKLKEGYKVTRKPWIDGVYFLMDGDTVKSYQPLLTHYVYNEDIMISDGWEVIGKPEIMYTFCEIIPFIQKGERVKLVNWKEKYIYYDFTIKTLIINAMEQF